MSRYIRVQGYLAENNEWKIDQGGRSVKIGISWYGSTRYLDVNPPTREDVERLGSMQLTCEEPYSQ